MMSPPLIFFYYLFGVFRHLELIAEFPPS